MSTASHQARRYAMTLLFIAAIFWPGALAAQTIPGIDPNIEAVLLADGAAQPGETLTAAIRFTPISDEWHGYWKNPGDAGYGMQLDWDLPAGWIAGEPEYPVPSRLLISDLMNHIYEGSYTVLVPLTVAANAPTTGTAVIGLEAQWLACTDVICVPEQGRFSLTVPLGGPSVADPAFTTWRAAIPPVLDRQASFTVVGNTLRFAVPVPAALDLPDPHIFIATTDLVQYAATQQFSRDGDLLIAQIPLAYPGAEPERIEAILAFGGGDGVQFLAEPGDVSVSGTPLASSHVETPALGVLLLAALVGGLILNIMPCVFPILSLKAISLVRAGASEADARREGIAYAAGVVLACIALGAVMLALRAAGQQVGWAFQLQEPAVVVALLVLAAVITANFAGLFELPSISLTRSGKPASAFATGLLAAVAATPCSGPFMAAAIGAALLLPAAQALLLFAVLGLGLSLPFLLIGFVPALRQLLPRPGPWMERFRRVMAIPMGLTALALVWLVSRMGGQGFAMIVMVLIGGLMIALMVTGRLQKQAKMAWPAFGLIAAPFALFAAFALPSSYSPAQSRANESLLDPLPYSAQALAEARASGQPVFLWFTADWCVTCKVNERVAIEREATRAAFDAAGVIAMRGDWTRPDAEITAYLTSQGAAGVPLYIWYPPAGEAQPLPQVLAPDSLIDQATAP